MPKWTPEQNQLLHECAQLGAKKCRDLLRQQCNVNRSVEAVRRHANRIQLSMRKAPNPCPQCGSTERIQSDGFCEKCHYDFLIAEQYAYADAQKKKATRDHEEASKRAKREYNRIRKEKEREAKENGWEPFKDWKKQNRL